MGGGGGATSEVVENHSLTSRLALFPGSPSVPESWAGPRNEATSRSLPTYYSTEKAVYVVGPDRPVSQCAVFSPSRWLLPDPVSDGG